MRPSSNSCFAALGAAALLALAACSEPSQQPIEAGIGPSPKLPPPERSLVPTVQVADARGWPAGTTPRPAPGLAVKAFATGLDHPRWLLALPNGDVLVAETNAPPKPDDNGGLKGWFAKFVMGKAGATTPSANRITLLRDTNGDGVADQRSVLLDRLNSPFGMTVAGDTLYVADTDALLRVPFRPGVTRVEAKPEKLADLPAGTINHHWTKNVLASPDGSKLYVTVGSNSNVGDNGIEAERGRAAIWEIDAATGAFREFATGLRNPNGMGWEPVTRSLWTVVNERDELGNDLVPDYLTAVRDGAFYGWPYSYYGQHVDERVSPPRPDLVAKAVAPDYALGSHTASLGLVFADGNRLTPAFAQGAFIGQHGSWNRKPPSGYKVIFVPFKGGRPAGAPIDVLTGFLSEDGDAYGRPVGVAIDAKGALLVADDVGNVVWRVTASGS